MAKKGLAVAIAIGKPKHNAPSADLGSPADLGGGPPRPPRNPRSAPPAPDDEDMLDTGDTGGGEEDQMSPGEGEGMGGEVTISLSHEQATALADVLQQIQDSLGGQGQGAPDFGEDMGDQDQMSLAGPMRGRGGYGS